MLHVLIAANILDFTTQRKLTGMSF